MKERVKKWREENKERIRERKSKKIKCECGKEISSCNFKRHKKICEKEETTSEEISKVD
mgnify:CR=1 FL=1